MKYLLKVILLNLLFVTIFSCQQKQEIDLLVYNARIQSVDREMTVYDAMAIDKGMIVALGETEVLQRKYAAKQSNDMLQQHVYPGFYDAHCHFYGLGIMQLQYADLKSADSMNDVLLIMQDHAEQLPQDEWLLGRGWDQNEWLDKQMPTNKELSLQFPDRPVLLIRVDGHAAIANDYLLQMAGFDMDTRIDGGELLHAGGVLTGILLEDAADSLKAMIPEPSDALVKKALLLAQEECLKNGLTAVTDAGLSTRFIHLIEEMLNSGELKMRFDVMLSKDSATLSEWVPKGIYHTEKLRVGAIKVYGDGALGSRGACLLEPYSDDPDNYGLMLLDQKELDRICKMAIKNGFQVNTHAIGDSTARFILQTYARFLQGKNDKRWRLEHAQTIHPNDIKLFGEYNIIPAVNTTHATSDMFWADERLGTERLQHAYAYKALLEQNGWCTNGSDFPIEGVNPIAGFYAAVERKNAEGKPEAGFQLENAWSREEALLAMTIWAAKGSFWEDKIGSLEVGKQADFVVFDGDLLHPNCAPLQKHVSATYIDGEEVFTE